MLERVAAEYAQEMFVKLRFCMSLASLTIHHPKVKWQGDTTG